MVAVMSVDRNVCEQAGANHSGSCGVRTAWEGLCNPYSERESVVLSPEHLRNSTLKYVHFSAFWASWNQQFQSLAHRHSAMVTSPRLAFSAMSLTASICCAVHLSYLKLACLYGTFNCSIKPIINFAQIVRQSNSSLVFALQSTSLLVY